MIWSNKVEISSINKMSKNMVTLLDIQFTEITDDSLTATMPVDSRTQQPFGILHGGASVVLAETVGSVASNLVIGPGDYLPVGLEINANHLRPVTEGRVTAKCTPIHIGKKSHVWDIRITNDEGKMVCVSRLTVAIIEKPKR